MVELPRVTFVPEWGVPDADWDSGSVAINALGQVAGYLVNDHLLWFGLIWEAGRVSVIAPDDARYLFEAEYLYPAAINASGTTLWYQDQAAVLWDGATVRVVNVPARQGSDIFPTDLNDRGQVVGGISYPRESRRAPATGGVAFLWEDGRTIELGYGDPDHRASRADAINNRGQVVGWSGSQDLRTASAFPLGRRDNVTSPYPGAR
jgi:uncharacterized membrane protein